MKNAFFTCIIIALSLSNANGEEWTNSKGQTITAGVVSVTTDGRVEFRINGKSFFYKISDITGDGRKKLDAMLAKKSEATLANNARKAARDAENAKFAREAKEPLPPLVKAIFEAGQAQSVFYRTPKKTWVVPGLMVGSDLALAEGDVGVINFEVVVEAIYSDSKVLLATPASERVPSGLSSPRTKLVPRLQRFIRINGISTNNLRVGQSLSPLYLGKDEKRPLKGIFVVQDREHVNGQEIEVLEKVPSETVDAVFRHQNRLDLDHTEPNLDYVRELYHESDDKLLDAKD